MNKIAFVAWAFAAACVVAWALLMYEPDFSGEYRAAASQNQGAFRTSDVSCVSIERHKGVIYDQKEYADPLLAQAITDVLSIKNVFFDAGVATCPWHFGVTAITGRDYAVTYNGEFARYLVSIALCERTSDGRANPNACLSKNIYVFNRSIEPHQLFVLALIGLVRSQATEWEAYRVKKGSIEGLPLPGTLHSAYQSWPGTGQPWEMRRN